MCLKLKIELVDLSIVCLKMKNKRADCWILALSMVFPPT